MNRHKLSRSCAIAIGLSLSALALFSAPLGAQEEKSAPTEGEITGKGNEKKPYAEEAVKHYNRGVELHQAGFLNQAISEYRAAIEADPRMEESYSNLGGIYAAQRSYTKAIEAFEKALQLKPDRPTTLNGYGTVLYAHGQIEEAKAKWKQAVQIDPTFASAYYNMGNALEGEKKNNEAVDAYARAIEVNPNMADAYYRIGSIYHKQKHPAQSKLLLNKSIELAPEADFVRDGRKQLGELNSQLQTEPEESEVKMNVVAPPAVSAKTPASQDAAPAADTATTEAGADDGAKKKKFGLFKKKTTPQKKVDMFVQQGESAQAAPAAQPQEQMQDLKEKPPE